MRWLAFEARTGRKTQQMRCLRRRKLRINGPMVGNRGETMESGAERKRRAIMRSPTTGRSAVSIKLMAQNRLQRPSNCAKNHGDGHIRSPSAIIAATPSDHVAAFLHLGCLRNLGGGTFTLQSFLALRVAHFSSTQEVNADRN